MRVERRNDGGREFRGSSTYRTAAGDFLFAKGTQNDDVYRYYPDGTWQFASTCRWFGAGGPALWCISGGNHHFDVSLFK